MRESTKRCLAFILMVMILVSSSLIVAQAEKTWVKSKDGVLEAAFISIATDNYPKAAIKLQYRIDEMTCKSGTWTYDGTEAITKYISNHPEYKNRKIKMSAEIVEVYECRPGIHYGISVKITINGTDTDYYYAGVNLWEEFPDEFIDYDVFHIAAGLKLYK